MTSIPLDEKVKKECKQMSSVQGVVSPLLVLYLGSNAIWWNISIGPEHDLMKNHPIGWFEDFRYSGSEARPSLRGTAWFLPGRRSDVTSVLSALWPSRGPR